MKPFLLLGTRAEDEAADNEYDAFLGFTGLDESTLVRVRLEQRPLGPVELDQWSGIFLGGGPFNASDDVSTKSAVQLRVEDELRGLLDEVLGTRLPAARRLLRDRRHRHAPRRHGRPDLQRADRSRAGHPHPGGTGRPVARRPAGHASRPSSATRRRSTTSRGTPCTWRRRRPARCRRSGSARNVYATQFHPELDIHGLCTRIEVYKHAGYFEPSEAESVKAMARAGHVFEPPKMLKSFVQRYAR